MVADHQGGEYPRRMMRAAHLPQLDMGGEDMDGEDTGGDDTATGIG